jgi:hypothetical protein
MVPFRPRRARACGHLQVLQVHERSQHSSTLFVGGGPYAAPAAGLYDSGLLLVAGGLSAPGRGKFRNLTFPEPGFWKFPKRLTRGARRRLA